MTRSNMSRVMNKVVMMCCKAVKVNLLAVVGLIVEPSTSIEKPNGYVEEYLSISQHNINATYYNTVISTSLSSFFFFIIMMLSNGRIHLSIHKGWSTVESYVRNSAELCGRRSRTGKMKFAASRNCISLINLIKGRHVIFRGPSISRKVLLKQSRASRSKNALIPINLLWWSLLTP